MDSKHAPPTLSGNINNRKSQPNNLKGVNKMTDFQDLQNRFNNTSTMVQLSGNPFLRFVLHVENVSMLNNQLSISGIDMNNQAGSLSVNLSQQFERDIFNGAMLNALNQQTAGAPFDLKNMIGLWIEFTYQEMTKYRHTYLNLRDIKVVQVQTKETKTDKSNRQGSGQKADKVDGQAGDAADDQA